MDPMIFLVISFLGSKIIKSQKGCGPKVANENAVWIGSGLTPTMSISREVDVRVETDGLWSVERGLTNADDWLIGKNNVNKKQNLCKL